ncbi:MAG: hypothetical protein AB1659_08710 [Thermodesulfobacteriota bacterium]
MVESIIIQWETVAWFLGAAVFIDIVWRIDRYFFSKKRFSEEENLSFLSRVLNTSEYNIFKLSSEKWHIGNPQVDDDFKDYLKAGRMPHYVRDYIRSFQKNGQITGSKPIRE